MGWVGQLLLGLWLALAATGAMGQASLPQVPGPSEEAATGGAARPLSDADYAAWDAAASRVETEIARNGTPSERLDELRVQLADWRAAFLNAQSANSNRIATLRAQIAALGPAPAAGATEAEEIADRRQALADQLVRLQAPGIAAEEAYRRADGMIREIDRVLRERQASQLLQLWPSPVNPANWPEAAIGFSDTLYRLWDESVTALEDRRTRQELGDKLPLIVLLLVLSLGLLTRGRQWMERAALRIEARTSASGRQVLALLVSLGQIVVPTLGVLAFAVALEDSGLLGPVGGAINAALTGAGFSVFAAAWLGSRAFPVTPVADDLMSLSPERRAEGRLHAVILGLLLGLANLRGAAMDPQAYSDATTAVMTFPILLAAGLVLWRVGRLLRSPALSSSKATSQGQSYGLRLLSLVGRAAGTIGILGPTLAAFGYVQAASALIFPAILSLALIAVLSILQRLIGDLWALITRNEATGREALVPVLAGFALTLLSLPVFALIWGARLADITEIWTRFREGFQMGETRISPTDFLLFAVVFVIGYTVTRLFQGALRSTILPKTSMDQGGQTALVAGVGYVGIFLAALIAINAAGIDLSGLAIVAGALSVGIGFGLQTIVSNFVSGIILLIERPVSEGDWIEVGGVQGRVRAISVRSTRIETFDRNDVIVPNADLITGQVTNWTRFNLSGRLIVPVIVALGTDPVKVERILREIAEAQPLAILNPPPLIVFMGYTATLMNFEIRVILRDVNFSLNVRSDINHQVMKRFAEEGINIVPPPAPPPEVDPVKTAETVLALARLVERDRPIPPGAGA